MYRRLVTFALLTVTLAVVALVIPLALSARDIVRAGNLSALAEEARLVADSWEAFSQTPAGEDLGDDNSPAPIIDLPGEKGEFVLVYPDGTVVGGPIPPAARPVVASAARGRSATLDTGAQGYAAAPAVFDEESTGVVLAIGDAADMSAGLGVRLLALAGLCAFLLATAGVAAWWMARRTVAPIQAMAATADAMAAGDLSTRAEPSGIIEIDDVGVALNRLAGRVQELLRLEREAASELAHQLRTPLTVLAADVDAVVDDDIRARLAEDVQTLQRTTDEIITNARRADREGLRPGCDAAAVVAGRAEFWAVLAEFQGRPMVLTGCDRGPLPVRLTEYDLTTAVDILLQNVFTHTDEGVPLALSVTGRAGGFVEVVVSDSGPGLGTPPASGDRAGSTGLGLAIAERIAVASGGSLTRGRSAEGGAMVTLRLGPAAG